MKKFIALSVLFLVSAGCAAKNTTQISPPVQLYNYTHQLQIGSKVLNVEIANNAEEQQQGLSDRSSMAQDQGMLFDFGADASSTPPFWMKDMDFNLDFIWIYQNKIVGITPNVPAPPKVNGSIDDSDLPIYNSPAPANQELEVNAGWAKNNNIQIGDQTKILN
jgi:hypothetical protein